MLIPAFQSVLCDLTIGKPRRSRKEVVYRKYRDIPIDEFCDDIGKSNLNSEISGTDLQELTSRYDAVLRELIEKYAPEKRKVLTEREEEPWSTNEISGERKKHADSLKENGANLACYQTGKLLLSKNSM